MSPARLPVLDKWYICGKGFAGLGKDGVGVA